MVTSHLGCRAGADFSVQRSDIKYEFGTYENTFADRCNVLNAGAVDRLGQGAHVMRHIGEDESRANRGESLTGQRLWPTGRQGRY